MSIFAAGLATAQPSENSQLPASTGTFNPTAALRAAHQASTAGATGAFAGLAEPVQVDLLLGEATTRVPIEVPRGRKGATPLLILTYASRAANGLVGRGWDLTIPHIKRNTRDGVPVDWDTVPHLYSSEDFVLVLPDQTIVLDRYLGNSGSTSLYGSTAEESFLRAIYEYVNNRWVVTDKSGMQYIFGAGAGSPAAARIGPFVGLSDTTFGWGLTEARDPSGNTITYEYKSFGVSGAANAYLYPSKIHYGANASAGYSNIFHVCFAYNADGTGCETATPPLRPDRRVDHSGGYAAGVDHRITGIKIWVDGESDQGDPTRRYVLSYAQDTLTGESLLQQVQLYNDQGQTLKPATFTYNSSAQGLGDDTDRIFFTDGKTQGPLRRNTLANGTRSDMIDMTGDGRPDWVECNEGAGGGGANTWYVYRNLGNLNGQFGPRESWSGPFCNFHTFGTELIDMNGDGLPDFVYSQLPVVENPAAGRDWFVWYNTGTGWDGCGDDDGCIWPVPPTTGDANFGLWVNPEGGKGGARDLNGDGFPDAIHPKCSDSSAPEQAAQCRVYLNSGNQFKAPGVLWRWPRIQGPLGMAPGYTNDFRWGFMGLETETTISLQDLTGDGLPDLMMSNAPTLSGTTGSVCYGGASHRTPCTSDAICGEGLCIDPEFFWGVYVNTGTGFAFESVCSGGSRNGQSCTVNANCTGNGTCQDLPSEYWAAPTRSNGTPLAISQACQHDPPLISNNGNWPPIGLEGALRDMNGDGLVDYVDSNVDCDQPTQGGPWQVFINTGNGFAAPVDWNGTAGILVEKWAETGIQNDAHAVVSDTFDVTGDAVADYVEVDIDNAFHVDVRIGDGEVPGTLQKQENGLGASTEIEYMPGSRWFSAPGICSGGGNDGQLALIAGCGLSVDCTDCDHAPFSLMVVKSLTTRTGFAGTGHTITKEYKFGAPYYDWQERQFRGYRWAVETEPFVGGGIRAVEFIQPGANAREPVTACGAPSQSCTALAAARPFKGKQKHNRIVDRTAYLSGQGGLRAETNYLWETASFVDPRLSGVQTTVVRLAEKIEKLHGTSTPTTSTTAKQEFDHDVYNNIAAVRRYADATLVSKTGTTYEYKTSNWIVDRPDQVEVRKPDNTLLSRAEYDYDSNGNLTQHRQWLDVSHVSAGNRTVARTTLEYTGSPGIAGQPTKIIDARSNATIIEYAATGPACDTHGLYPCKITNALSHSTRRSYRLEFGVVTAETDPNGATVEYDYDRFGRLYQIFRPLELNQDPSTLEPWRRFTYVLGSPGTPPLPSFIQTEIREPNDAQEFRKEVRFSDGLGRALETKGEGVVSGDSRRIIRDAVGFDTAGRVNRRYAPYTTLGAVDVYESPSGAATDSVFDALGRVTQITKPDGNQVKTTYNPAGITESHDENYVACGGAPGSVTNASCPGKRTVEQRDALGRLVNVKVYKGAAILDNETVNEYDAADRLSSTQIGADVNTKVTFRYDSLGRRIELTEKDSGQWVYGYDDADNLIYQNDPKQTQHLEWCFDALNRPKWKRAIGSDAYSGNSCTNADLRALYLYDSCTGGVGRLCTEIGANGYQTHRTYDARGRFATETRKIIAAGLDRTLSYDFTYDEADRLKTVGYPIPVDNEIELLSYGYSSAGHLVTAATPGNVYLAYATYDVFGRPLELSLADDFVDEVRVYFDSSANFRLKRLSVRGGSAPRQTWNYSPTETGDDLANGYDRAGNLLHIKDVSPLYNDDDDDERNNDWQYTYDGLGRLTNAAWGASALPATFQYDGLGNMSQGKLAFPNLSSSAVTFTPDSTRRHHILSMSPPGGSSPVLYEEDGVGTDGNGGLIYRPATISDDTEKAFSYDIDGRVRQVFVGLDTTESIYDDRGERIARIVNGTDVTFFFGRYVEVRGNEVTRHFYAGNRRIAFSRIPAPPGLSLAALPDGAPDVMLARASEDSTWHLALQHLGPDVGPFASAGGMIVLVVSTVLLGMAPGCVRVGLFGPVRRGRVAILVILYVVTLPAWPPGRRSATWIDSARACPEPAMAYPAHIVHVDHLGSTTLLTAYNIPGEVDGAVMEYYRYGPYGKMRAYDHDGVAVPNGTELTDLTYTGQRWDSRARLYYYGARFYDPMIARFVTTDPAREYMNLYAYVKWSPMRFSDPTGMWITELGFIAALNGQIGFDPGFKPESQGLGGGLLGFTSVAKSRAGVNSGLAEFGASIQAAAIDAFQAALTAAVAAEAQRLGAPGALTPGTPLPQSTAGPSTGTDPGSASIGLNQATLFDAVQLAATFPLLPPPQAIALDFVAWHTTGQQINAAIAAGQISPQLGMALHDLNGVALGVGVAGSFTGPAGAFASSAFQLGAFGVIGYNTSFGPVASQITGR